VPAKKYNQTAPTKILWGDRTLQATELADAPPASRNPDVSDPEWNELVDWLQHATLGHAHTGLTDGGTKVGFANLSTGNNPSVGDFEFSGGGARLIGPGDALGGYWFRKDGSTLRTFAVYSAASEEMLMGDALTKFLMTGSVVDMNERLIERAKPQLFTVNPATAGGQLARDNLRLPIQMSRTADEILQYDPIGGFLEPFRWVDVFDDFLVGSGSNGILSWLTTGAGTIDKPNSDATNAWGLLRMKSGAVSGQSIALHSEGLPSPVWTQWNLGFEELKTKLSSTVAVVARFGMCDGIADPPSSGVYFEYDSAGVSGNWDAVVRKAGVETRTDTLTVPTTATYQKLRVARTAIAVGSLTAGDTAFYINAMAEGSALAVYPSTETNIPTTNLTPFAYIKTTAAVDKHLINDWFRLKCRTGVLR